MHVRLTESQRALRAELRAYFGRLITPAIKEALRDHAGQGGDSPLYKDVIRQIGADGYLAVGWPVEYGGRGFGAVEQMIFVQEALRSGAPIPFLTLSTVGPTIMAFGSEKQKAEFLPRIANGTLHFGIGYTEPNAGTDLASLKTRAEMVDGGFRVNGNKLYTSHAESADYIWLAARTDPEAVAHRGISILLVDTRDPGFSFTPLHTVVSMRTNITYYDNVMVPADMLVGPLHGGWKLIVSQLNYERIGISGRGIYGEDLCAATLRWARTPDAAGRRPIDDFMVQRLIASAWSRLESLRLFNARLACDMRSAQPDPAFASAAKVVGVETLVEACRELKEALGLGGIIRHGSEAALIAGEVEHFYRRIQLNTFGGGSGEVMREIVAQRGLGMPRVPR